MAAASQTVLKAKDVSQKWEQTVIDGISATDPNSFDGLKTLLPSVVGGGGQVITPAASGSALTLALLDQLIDLIKGGKPDALLMSARTRRRLKALFQASTHYVERGETAFGARMMMYDGIPVLRSDFILDTEAADDTSGSTFSSIYALHLDPADGLVGLTNGGIEVIDVGQLETKDASRVRVRWYVGMAALRLSAIARMIGIN